MSMLRRLVADIATLLFPRECAACGDSLADGEEFLCTACRYRIPMTGFVEQAENPMKERLTEFLPIKQASALFYFNPESDWRRMIHDFKYRGRWSHARNMGVWFGHLLRSSGNYDDVDVIVPVPLHNRKRLKRSYNQSDYIADGIALVFGAKVERHALVRIINNDSQTRHSRSERWENVEGVFAVRRPERLAGRHVLLVDDVLTTGATALACCEALFTECRDIEVSVVALSISRKGFGFDM